MKGPKIPTYKRQISKQMHRRPANQYDSDSSMTNEVHDTHLMFLGFLDIKKFGWLV